MTVYGSNGTQTAKENTSKFPLAQLRSNKTASRKLRQSSNNRARSDLMSSGVPANFDRQLRSALSSQSRDKSRSIVRNSFNGMRTHEPVRRQSRSRNSLNVSNKLFLADDGIITNITVRKRSTGAAKNRLLIDPQPQSKSPNVHTKQMAASSKNTTKRSAHLSIAAKQVKQVKQKKSAVKERKTSKSAKRLVSRSKSKGKKLTKVQTDRLLFDQGLISQESCSQIQAN